MGNSKIDKKNKVPIAKDNCIFPNIPLISHNYVALKLKTTGTDPCAAPLQEIGAIRIQNNKIDDKDVFSEIINPTQALVPYAQSPLAHNTQSALSNFALINPKLNAFIGHNIIVSHNAAFEITHLRENYIQNNLQWVQPRILCTQLLGRIIAPNLLDYSLYTFAKWLGIYEDEDTKALDEARLLARVFLRMLPMLRNAGIRTLAEAEAGSLLIKQSDPAQHKKNWVQPISRPTFDMLFEDAHRKAVDKFLYQKRNKDIMTAPAAVVRAETPLNDVLDLMLSRKISSVFVRSEQKSTSGYGIVTERDILRALRINLQNGINLPVQHFMNYPLHVVHQEALGYRALGRMRRLNIRHLGVIDDNGKLLGAITPKDLLIDRSMKQLLLADGMEQATNEAELGRVWAELPVTVHGLLKEGLNALDVAAVISREIHALTQAATRLAEQRMIQNKRGSTPCQYCVLVLGSAGRGESLLDVEQQNAIIYNGNRTHDVWFEELGEHLADILHSVGLSYSRKNIMASQSGWRKSVTGWRKILKQWLQSHNINDLSSIEIFLDAAPVSGSLKLGEEVWQDTFKLAVQSLNFQSALMSKINNSETVLNFLGQLKTQKDSIALKDNGLNILAAIARLAALRYEGLHRSSYQRLKTAYDNNAISYQDMENAQNAFNDMMKVLLDQQLVDISAIRPVMAAANVSTMSAGQKKDLIRSLRQIEQLKKKIF